MYIDGLFTKKEVQDAHAKIAVHRAHCEQELFGEARMPDFPMLGVDGPRNASFPSSLRRATPEQLQEALQKLEAIVCAPPTSAVTAAATTAASTSTAMSTRASTTTVAGTTTAAMQALSLRVDETRSVRKAKQAEKEVLKAQAKAEEGDAAVVDAEHNPLPFNSSDKFLLLLDNLHAHTSSEFRAAASGCHGWGGGRT